MSGTFQMTWRTHDLKQIIKIEIFRPSKFGSDWLKALINLNMVNKMYFFSDENITRVKEDRKPFIIGVW